MKVSKRQLRYLIREEKQRLSSTAIVERQYPKFPGDEEAIGRWYDALSDMVYSEWSAAGITPVQDRVEVNQVVEALRSLATDLEGQMG